MRLYSLVDLTGNVNMIEKFFTHLGQIGGLCSMLCTGSNVTDASTIFPPERDIP